MQEIMAEASKIVLDGFEIGTDAELIRHPDRFRDPRGVKLWCQIQDLTAKIEARVA